MISTYSPLVNLGIEYGIQIKPDSAMIAIGVLSDGSVLQGGLSALHVILTKFMLISLTQVDTDGARYDTEAIWKAAVARCNGRLSALHTLLHRLSISQDAIDRQPIPLTSFNKAIAPLAELVYDEDQQCALVTSAPWTRLLAKLDLSEPSTYVCD